MSLSLPVHLRGSAAGIEYAAVGSGTLLVGTEASQLMPEALRVFIARLEVEETRLPRPIVQFGWYLPHIQRLNNPFEAARSIVAFAKRHPHLVATFDLLPRQGLVSMVVDMALRALPRFECRIVHDKDSLVRLLRKREPELPLDCLDLLFPPVERTGTHG